MAGTCWPTEATSARRPANGSFAGRQAQGQTNACQSRDRLRNHNAVRKSLLAGGATSVADSLLRSGRLDATTATATTTKSGFISLSAVEVVDIFGHLIAASQ